MFNAQSRPNGWSFWLRAEGLMFGPSMLQTLIFGVTVPDIYPSITVFHNSRTMAVVTFQGPPFLKVGGSLGPHFIILDPSLGDTINMSTFTFCDLYHANLFFVFEQATDADEISEESFLEKIKDSKKCK